MATKITYTGAFDFLPLYFGVAFIGNSPTLKIDEKHDRIDLIDPNNSKNQIVLDVDHLKVGQDSEITGGTITDIHFKVDGKEAITIADMHASAVKFQQAYSGGLPDMYPFLIDSLKGTIHETGDQYTNRFEFGSGGKGVVDAGAGDDQLYVWHSKNIVYNGGDGTDQLIFDLEIGEYPVPKQGLTIDLRTGEGTNPYGGSLMVTSVENISGTTLGDHMTGSKLADTLYGGLGGNDVLKGLGGDDTLSVAADDKNNKVTVDGGDGSDRLIYDISFAHGTNTLDLADASKDTGIFTNDHITGCETFNFNDFQLAGAPEHAGINFTGTKSNETIACSYGNDTFDARGGNDTMSGQYGDNRFIFRSHFGNDTITDFSLSSSNIIQFDKTVFADFDAVKAHATDDGHDLVIDAGKNGTLRLDFVNVADLSADSFVFV
jgi:Ca2+-binding RTX toxin-like protein